LNLDASLAARAGGGLLGLPAGPSGAVVPARSHVPVPQIDDQVAAACRVGRDDGGEGHRVAHVADRRDELGPLSDGGAVEDVQSLVRGKGDAVAAKVGDDALIVVRYTVDEPAIARVHDHVQGAPVASAVGGDEGATLRGSVEPALAVDHHEEAVHVGVVGKLAYGLAAVLGLPSVVLAPLGVEKMVAVVGVDSGVGAVDRPAGEEPGRPSRVYVRLGVTSRRGP